MVAIIVVVVSMVFMMSVVSVVSMMSVVFAVAMVAMVAVAITWASFGFVFAIAHCILSIISKYYIIFNGGTEILI